MEEQERNETLSRLYTLRAGLSAIALEKDKADEIFDSYEKEKEPINSQIDRCKQNFDYYVLQRSDWSSTYFQAKSKYDFNQSEIQRLHQELKESGEVESQKAKRASYKKNIKKSIFPLILGIILAIMGFIFLTVISDMFIAGMICMIVGVVIAIISGSIIKVNYSADNNFKWSKNVSEKNSQIDCMEMENRILYEPVISEHKKQMDNMKEAYRKEDEKCIELEKCKKEIEEKQLSNSDIILHNKAGIVIYEGLQKEFDKFIHEQDWEGVDYLIFVLETGRAESMKEALLLFDKERQTNMVVNAINHATKSISDTINIGLKNLSLTVAECCKVLSQQMRDMLLKLGKISEDLNKHIEINLETNKQLTSLIDSTNLMNALQEKANTTSMQLASDMKMLCQNSNYADWRLRNNI